METKGANIHRERCGEGTRERGGRGAGGGRAEREAIAHAWRGIPVPHEAPKGRRSDLWEDLRGIGGESTNKTSVEVPFLRARRTACRFCELGNGALFALLAKYENRLVGADGVDRIGENIGPGKLSVSHRAFFVDKLTSRGL